MLHRVSDHNKLKAAEEMLAAVHHGSISKTANREILNALAVRARAMVAAGTPIKEIAAKLNLGEALIRGFIGLRETTVQNEKIKVASKNDTGAKKHLNQAKEAYEELYAVRLNKVAEHKEQIRTNKTILSGNTHSDIGGPIRKTTQNTIFEPDALEKAAKVKGEGEMLKTANARREAKRHSNQQSTRGCVDEIYGDGKPNSKPKPMAKSASVSPMNQQTSKTNYNNHLPSHSISIFDNGDFDRLAKSTEGEKVSMQKTAAKKEEHKYINTPVTSREIMKKMLNAFLES